MQSHDLLEAITTGSLHNCAVAVLCFPIQKVDHPKAPNVIREFSYFSHHFEASEKIKGMLIGAFADSVREAGYLERGRNWTRDPVVQHSELYTGNTPLIDEFSSCVFHPVSLLLVLVAIEL